MGKWQDRTVAVKRLKAIYLQLDDSVLEEFNREMEVMRSLSHRNIVFFYGFFIFVFVFVLF